MRKSTSDPTLTRLDWDDLRFVLAVAEGGSLNGGAALLKVRHSTVLRRLDALEQRLQVRLFERLRQGYQPTEAGELIVEQARLMRPGIDALQRRILGRDLQLSGQVRLSTSYIVMAYLLPPLLAGFARAHPAIEVEVTQAAAMVDLSRRDADVALRSAFQVPDHLVGREVGVLRYRAYAARGAPDLPQALTPLDELCRSARWLAFEQGRSARVTDRWMNAEVDDARVVLRVDQFPAMVAMLRTGLGVGLLPSFAGEAEAGLIAVSEEIAALRTPLWLLTHPDLRGAARIRRLMQHLAEGLAPALAG